MSLPTSTMETLLLEDLSCWDPIEDLQLTEELFPSAILNNLEKELGLGSEIHAKDPIEKKIGSVELDLTLPISEIDFQNGCLDGWMEDKVDLTSFLEVDLLDDGVHLALEKTYNGINIVSTPGVTETDSITLSSVEIPPDECNLTPPESPQYKSSEFINNLDTNSVSGASTEEVLVSVTPPDTPPDGQNILFVNISSPSSPELEPNLKSSNRKRKHSTKPYDNSKVDCTMKKLRKRDQNRDAATRYRMKKRAEIENLASQESALQDKNTELKERVDSLSSELKYLKGLLKEIILAKLA